MQKLVQRKPNFTKIEEIKQKKMSVSMAWRIMHALEILFLKTGVSGKTLKTKK